MEVSGGSYKGSLAGEWACCVIDSIRRFEDVVASAKLRLRGVSEDGSIRVRRWIYPRWRKCLLNRLLEWVITRQIAELKT